MHLHTATRRNRASSIGSRQVSDAIRQSNHQKVNQQLKKAELSNNDNSIPTHGGTLSLKLQVHLGAPNKVIISLFL
jgi:hypothetical protein